MERMSSAKLSVPCLSTPKPKVWASMTIVWTAMAITAVAMARGMLRRGLSVSSPREAAPLETPEREKPEDRGQATVPNPTPFGGVKGESVKL